MGAARPRNRRGDGSLCGEVRPTRPPGALRRSRLTRRDFLRLTAGAAFPGLARVRRGPPLRRDVFPDFGDPDTPYLGLPSAARRARLQTRIEGAIPPQLRGTFYRIAPVRQDCADGRSWTGSAWCNPLPSTNGVRYRNRLRRNAMWRKKLPEGSSIPPGAPRRRADCSPISGGQGRSRARRASPSPGERSALRVRRGEPPL